MNLSSLLLVLTLAQELQLSKQGPSAYVSEPFTMSSCTTSAPTQWQGKAYPQPGAYFQPTMACTPPPSTQAYPQVSYPAVLTQSAANPTATWSSGQMLPPMVSNQVPPHIQDYSARTPVHAYGPSAYSGRADPLTYLQSAKSVRYYDICDFINVAPPIQVESDVPNDTDVSSIIDHIVRVRSGPLKPKLADVSHAEWGLANTRIMDQLFQPGHPAIRDYMAYTTKIFRLFMPYDRVRVLQYDREYRMLQAANGFRWGEDWPFMTNINLKSSTSAKPMHSSVQANKARSNGVTNDSQRSEFQRSRQPQSNPDTCIQFNDPKGCAFGRRCIYQHVCRTCKGKHPKFAHNKTQDDPSGVVPASPTTKA